MEKERIELTEDPLKNILLMVSHLDEQQQRDLAHLVLGIYLCAEVGNDPTDQKTA